MLRALPYKTKQFFILLIKLSIVGGALYFIYNKIASNENLKFLDFIHFLNENGVFSTKNVLFLVILTFFNWFFEILKWQNLTSFLLKISFFDAFKQSTSSLTASLFTPNRLGDYAAKAIYYDKTYRKRILLLNLLSNMAQMSITLVLGCFGLYVFASKYELDLQSFRFIRFAVIMFFIGLLTLFGVRQNKIKMRWFSLERVLNFVKSMPLGIHMKNGFYSLVRYLIFSYQFYFLLQIFGVEVSYYNAMIAITSVYLLSSLIPSIFLFDAIIKGSVALYLFSIVGVNEFTILSIIALMWILNFVLPSLIGSFYVMKFSTYKSVITRE